MPPKVMAVVERTCDHAEGESLRISRPELAHTRAVFRRPDGTSRFRPRGSEIYTTQDLLDAEARLLDAARAMGEPSVSPLVAADVCSRKAARQGPPAVGRPGRGGAADRGLRSGCGRPGRGGRDRQKHGDARGQGGLGALARTRFRGRSCPRRRPPRRCSATWWESRPRTPRSG